MPPRRTPNGTWGLANVDPGFVTVTATRASDGTAIGAAQVQAKAGVITVVYVEPTPDGGVVAP